MAPQLKRYNNRRVPHSTRPSCRLQTGWGCSLLGPFDLPRRHAHPLRGPYLVAHRSIRYSTCFESSGGYSGGTGNFMLCRGVPAVSTQARSDLAPGTASKCHLFAFLEAETPYPTSEYHDLARTGRRSAAGAASPACRVAGALGAVRKTENHDSPDSSLVIGIGWDKGYVRK